jgi:hypothetical protein
MGFQELPSDSARGWAAVATLDKLCNTCWTDDPATIHEALKISEKFLKKKNGESQHRITACGTERRDGGTERRD